MPAPIVGVTKHPQRNPHRRKSLDTPIARRSAEKVQWLAEHDDQIHPETLTGPCVSLCKRRVGDWRVLDTSDPVQYTITVHVIAHRSKV